MKNILDDVFNASEEDVETFMDVIKTRTGNDDRSDFTNRFSGEADQVSAPELVDQVSGLIRISHGWHGDDYVWHISSNTNKQVFRSDGRQIVYAIAKTMNEFIPQTIEVRIWLPYADWEIQEYTYKAIDLKNCWQVNKQVIEKLNLSLFTVLNPLV